MRRITGIGALWLLAACAAPPESVLEPRSATPFPPGDPRGAAPYLVRDIRPGPASSHPKVLAGLNGRLYLAAEDGEHGTELWTSDGTATGTRLLRDICSGPCSSSPGEPLRAYDRLYFAASHGAGHRPWITDGTTAGTMRVATQPGSEPTAPSGFVLLGKEIIFVASDDLHGRELWKTDGTASGTVLIADVAPGADGGITTTIGEPDLRIIGDQVFFAANDRVAGHELWRSDGTTPGTALVKDIFAGQRSSITHTSLEATVLDGLLYFRADDGRGNQLWRSDGTERGTWSLQAPLRDLYLSLAPFDGLLLFRAGGPLPALSRLWRTDGTLEARPSSTTWTPGTSSGSRAARSSPEPWACSTSASCGGPMGLQRGPCSSRRSERAPPNLIPRV